MFSPDSRKLAYKSETPSGKLASFKDDVLASYLIVGDRSFEGLGRTRVFNEDGSEVGFGVLRGHELRWVVMKTR